MRGHTWCHRPNRSIYCAALQAVLWGVSYDATLAFFSVAEGHPAICGAALLYPFWCVCNAGLQHFCRWLLHGD